MCDVSLIIIYIVEEIRVTLDFYYKSNHVCLGMLWLIGVVDWVLQIPLQRHHVYHHHQAEDWKASPNI